VSRRSYKEGRGPLEDSWRLERRAATLFLVFRGSKEAWRALEQIIITIEETLAPFPGFSLSCNVFYCIAVVVEATRVLLLCVSDPTHNKMPMIPLISCVLMLHTICLMKCPFLRCIQIVC
jgi:hypothetical protein